jgi:multidrug transporter EmrE-like cation transporter
MPYISILGSILLGAFAQILLKFGTFRVNSHELFKIFTNLYTVGGLGLYALSALLWIFAISKVQLSFAYPMVSLGYVVVFVFSYLFFGEIISVRRAFGLATILVGVIVIAKS